METFIDSRNGRFGVANANLFLKYRHIILFLPIEYAAEECVKKIVSCLKIYMLMRYNKFDISIRRDARVKNIVFSSHK